MATPSTAAGLPSARDQWMDRGENLDVSQVIGLGGVVNSGQTWNNQLYGQAMAQDTITATASGTQANGFKVLGPLARVTVVATIADSITLPPAIRGMEITVANDAVNSMNVFPSSAAQGGVTGGDTINSLAANAAFAQAGGSAAPIIFICFTNGFWRTK